MFANEHAFMFCTVQLHDEKGFEIQMIKEKKSLATPHSATNNCCLVFSPRIELHKSTGYDKTCYLGI